VFDSSRAFELKDLEMTETFGFVVLNYLNHEETQACVASICALPGSNYHVVVVDNHSPNNAFDVLSNAFKDDPRVTVLQSARNGGYSFGNNVGITALAELGIHDVVIATSDTRVGSRDILKRLAAAKREGVAVLGPAITGPDSQSQNPLLQHLSLRYIAALHLGRAWEALKKTASSLGLRRSRTGGANCIPVAPPTEPTLVDVYMVHGCFLYLSAVYLRQFPQLDEDLFMYGEEDLIAYNCVSRNLRMVYDPGVRVFHGDAKSTSKECNFRNRTMETSLTVLKEKLSLGKLVRVYIRAS